MPCVRLFLPFSLPLIENKVLEWLFNRTAFWFKYNTFKAALIAAHKFERFSQKLLIARCSRELFLCYSANWKSKHGQKRNNTKYKKESKKKHGCRCGFWWVEPTNNRKSVSGQWAVRVVIHWSPVQRSCDCGRTCVVHYNHSRICCSADSGLQKREKPNQLRQLQLREHRLSAPLTCLLQEFPQPHPPSPASTRLCPLHPLL